MKAVRACSLYFAFIIAVVPASARAQWTEPVRIGAPGGVLYPQILAQGDTLHVVYSNNDQGWKIGYVRSADGGDTWSEQEVLSDTANTTQTRLPAIISNHDTLLTLWLCALEHWPYDYNIGSSISHDKGLTWGQVQYVLDPGWTYPFYLAASGSGSVINVETSGAPGDTMIFFNIRSTNFGESWLNPVELFRAPNSSRPDQAQFENSIHFTWSGRFTRPGIYETYIISSFNNGESWSDNYMISSNDSILSRSCSILVNGHDTVGVSWTDWKYSPYWMSGDIFYRQSSDSGYSWRTEHEVTYDHLADYSDICATAETLYVVWEDFSLGITRRKIYYKRSTDSGETWGERYWIDGTDDDSWNPALAASNGKVYVVWADSREDPGMGLYFSRYEDETGVSDEGALIPENIELQVYPNPFNPNVNISLKMRKGGDAEIGIYDVNGRLVKTIFKGGKLEQGTHKFTWDATDAFGKEVSSGSYFAVASTPQGKITKTLTLIR